MRIGPVIIDDGDATITFDPADDRGIGHYRTTRNLASNERYETHPLSLSLSLEGYVAIDLAARRLVLAPGHLEGVLSAQIQPEGAAQRALFANAAPIELPLASIAAGAVLDLDLAMRPGPPVPLNVPPEGGRAPLEALDGRLKLQLGRRPNPATPGALVRSASLAPPEGGRLRLRTQGLRNSRNAAEVWTTDGDIPLALRPRGNGMWTSALLAPLGDGLTNIRLTREGGLVGAGAAAKVLPMHTWFGQSQFLPEPAASGRLVCTKTAGRPAGTVVPWAAADLQWRATRPWLRFENGQFLHTRPGDAYRGTENVWRFEPTGAVAGGAPLLPRAAWASGEPEPPSSTSSLRKANEELNAAFRGMRLTSRGEVHETGLADRTNNPGQPPSTQPAITELVPDGDLPLGELRLQTHPRRFELAAPRLSAPAAPGPVVVTPLTLSVPITVPQAQPVDFAVVWPSLQNMPGRPPWVWVTDIASWAQGLAGAIDPEAPIVVGDVLSDIPHRPTDFPLALVKFTRQRTLGELLAEMASSLSGTAKQKFDAKRDAAIAQISEVDASMTRPQWVGVVAFDVPVDYDAFPLLKAIVPSGPKDAPRLRFMSVAPREPGSARSDVAVSASIHWENTSAPTPTASNAEQEATFRPELLSVSFRDRRLVKFQSRAQLEFRSFLGVKGAGGATKKIDIVGSARRVHGAEGGSAAFEIRFAAEVKGGEKLTIFPVGDTAPPFGGRAFIKSAWLRRVEVVDAPHGTGRKPEIEIDGAIEFQKPDLDFGEGLDDFFNSLREVAFSNLRIELPPISGPDFRLLTLRYPSLKFDLSLPHVALIGDALKLKFHQLVVDWATPGLPAFDFGRFPRLPLPNTADLNLKLPRIIFVGRLDFGSLPDLFARSLSGFSLEGVFGLNFETGQLKGLPFVGIGGFGFDGLNFDLLSFITLRIESLRLGPKRWEDTDGAALSWTRASLDVLRFPVLREGSGAFFSQDNDRGDGFWVAFRGYDLSLLKFDWGFVARNVDFPPEIPKALLTPPPKQSLGEHFDQLTDQLVGAWDKGKIAPARGAGGRGWTFAASIQAFEGAFKGRALLQDGGFTGLTLYGDAFKKLLNWDFVFVGLYRKDITPGEDYFYFSVTLPPMTFGSIRFTGGEIAAEIFTSGDFTADLGFPWPATGGGRAWERTLGAIVTPGQASGGFYVRKRQQHVPATGRRELTVGGGVAIQWGLGATFGGGVFEVWVRVGLYIIVEGQVTLEYQSITNMQVVAFRLQGAAGVLVEGYGRIDWWVITVRVGVRASAEIRTALTWDKRVSNRLYMPIEAELHVSAYAEACIGGGCARVCRGIRVGLNIPVRYQLEFG